MSFLITVHFHTDQIVIDLIYNQTPLLQKPPAMVQVFYNGLSMLIWQKAAISFSWWTGILVEDCYEHVARIILREFFDALPFSIRIQRIFLNYEYSR